jgi:CRP-like cAMP-binding protein
VETGELGKYYEDGEIIIRQGEIGECMYVIQEGEVEIFLEEGGKEHPLVHRYKGEFFGEMALFDRDVRSATVRALGRARILTVDKKNLLRRVSKDPSMAIKLLETMSNHVRELLVEVNRLSEIVDQQGDKA